MDVAQDKMASNGKARMVVCLKEDGIHQFLGAVGWEDAHHHHRVQEDSMTTKRQNITKKARYLFYFAAVSLNV